MNGAQRAVVAGAVAALSIGLITSPPAGGAHDAPDAGGAGDAQDAGDAYRETWQWCTDRFPYREDLQEACQWGAFEMLPGPQFATEEEVKDA